MFISPPFHHPKSGMLPIHHAVRQSLLEHVFIIIDLCPTCCFDTGLSLPCLSPPSLSKAIHDEKFKEAKREYEANASDGKTYEEYQLDPDNRPTVVASQIEIQNMIQQYGEYWSNTFFLFSLFFCA